MKLEEEKKMKINNLIFYFVIFFVVFQGCLLSELLKFRRAMSHSYMTSSKNIESEERTIELLHSFDENDYEINKKSKLLYKKSAQKLLNNNLSSIKRLGEITKYFSYSIYFSVLIILFIKQIHIGFRLTASIVMLYFLFVRDIFMIY